MKVLIVDDQYDQKIEEIIAQLKKQEITDIHHVMYTREAYQKMLSCEYDLVLLDLHIREDIGEEISTDAGSALLELIFTDDAVIRPKFTVGITSHEESYQENIDIFQKFGVTLHLFNSEPNFIDNILNIANRPSSGVKEYDVAIITALRHIEFDALLRNGSDWKELLTDDCNKYYTTTFVDKQNVERSIIATFCPKMGMPVASAVTMKVLNKFSPKLLVMTGIAAGVEGKVNLGDILAAELVWDWGSGKLEGNESESYLHADPDPIKMNPSLAIELRDISENRQYVDQIKYKWCGNSPDTQLSMHVGAVASGSSVLADYLSVDNIKKQKRSVIGVEMEAYGVLTAVSLVGKKPPETLILKSVCDFANPHKNDDWQKYAAYTSTSMAFEVISKHIDFS
ncbi:phosphorylase family protein [Alteromonas macleodii]|jgi:nucleoside phosphorylase|uniref:Phosphorylase superfamily protein n=1 Tax=Alteromonas macleodii TaxID=28108 RepID=A0AB36FKB2_ALTMA|nr:hypothetical protein [Alteromonas macleodii]MDK2763422.1 hypothetical protein [Alteromonas macleodii]OES24247.1 phosphorylase superfamily protein [Alteromonas macleodii]OES25278.1 phosphorylase superfamily protein [Alteromonas macleodii]OES25483.1 phosphorylase superfamily protein [Alteromonas macleodii]OES39040.1 phosphorylase superfamily protein [Alteromonas macleodii]